MGWILVNIVLPISVPLLYMLGAKLVDLSPEVKARTRLLRVVQDGQLGWVTMGFAASSTYDVVNLMTDSKPHAAGFLAVLLTAAVGLLAVAGFLAALGSLYPVAMAAPATMSLKAWATRYRLFVVTAVCTALSGALFIVVHFLA